MKIPAFLPGQTPADSSGEKQLEADVAVAATGTFVSLSQANNVGEGIWALFVCTSSLPTVLPHGVTQTGVHWFCLHQLGSGDKHFPVLTALLIAPPAEALSLVLKSAVDQADFRHTRPAVWPFSDCQAGLQWALQVEAEGHEPWLTVKLRLPVSPPREGVLMG